MKDEKRIKSKTRKRVIWFGIILLSCVIIYGGFFLFEHARFLPRIVGFDGKPLPVD